MPIVSRSARRRTGLVRDPAGRPPAPCGIDALERRTLLAADLTCAFAGAVPASLPPGARNRISVRVSTVGDELAAGTVAVKLFASADDVLDGADAPLATVSKAVKLAAGKATTVKLAFPSPTDVPDGDYVLFARVD